MIITYLDLVEQAQQRCKTVENSPESRYALRQDFYTRFDHQYGQSELDFLQWEISRGVLNSLDAPRPGSRWWRNVNLHFIYLSELAGLMFSHDIGNDIDHEKVPTPVLKWLEFLQAPTQKSWYRAYNAAILAGFEQYKQDAQLENPIEQQFINIVLYRLMFAQSLVEQQTVFGQMGAIIADPLGFSAKLIDHRSQYYPAHYPFTEQDRNLINGEGLSLGALQVTILDHEFILPNLDALYDNAAKLNGAPFLVDYQQDRSPIYPCEPTNTPERKYDTALESILVG